MKRVLCLYRVSTIGQVNTLIELSQFSELRSVTRAKNSPQTKYLTHRNDYRVKRDLQISALPKQGPFFLPVHGGLVQTFFCV